MMTINFLELDFFPFFLYFFVSHTPHIFVAILIKSLIIRLNAIQVFVYKQCPEKIS